jgi:hypothetical protein
MLLQKEKNCRWFVGVGGTYYLAHDMSLKKLAKNTQKLNQQSAVVLSLEVWKVLSSEIPSRRQTSSSSFGRVPVVVYWSKHRTMDQNKINSKNWTRSTIARNLTEHQVYHHWRTHHGVPALQLSSSKVGLQWSSCYLQIYQFWLVHSAELLCSPL